jgi:hypothetical protein
MTAFSFPFAIADGSGRISKDKQGGQSPVFVILPKGGGETGSMPVGVGV